MNESHIHSCLGFTFALLSARRLLALLRKVLKLCRALLGQYVAQSTSPDPFYLEVKIALKPINPFPRSAGCTGFSSI